MSDLKKENEYLKAMVEQLQVENAFLRMEIDSFDLFHAELDEELEKRFNTKFYRC